VTRQRDCSSPLEHSLIRAGRSVGRHAIEVLLGLGVVLGAVMLPCAALKHRGAQSPRPTATRSAGDTVRSLSDRISRRAASVCLSPHRAVALRASALATTPHADGPQHPDQALSGQHATIAKRAHSSRRDGAKPSAHSHLVTTLAAGHSPRLKRSRASPHAAARAREDPSR
jgi:hypothetical protein